MTTRKNVWLRDMTMREASEAPEDAAERAGERDLSSLARLLHYAMCEANELGQLDAAALIDAAILSLKASEALSSDIADEARAGEERLRDMLRGQPARLFNRKFC